MAIKAGWIWIGSDLSESVSVSEVNLATRLLVDLAVFTSSIQIEIGKSQNIGFNTAETANSTNMSFQFLKSYYDNTPGLVADKIKSVLRFVADNLPKGVRIVFAYDEAQNLSDNAEKEQYPLSVLLEVFQAIQIEQIPFMLALAGLPTLFPKLVEARTYAERMFTVLFLDQLNRQESKEAITVPLENSDTPLKPTDESIDGICQVSGGYPYFIQFFCREAYDIWSIDSDRSIPMQELIQKLDTDFFAGRWSRVSDRQRDLMYIISLLPSADSEFTVQEIVTESKKFQRPFSNSHTNQMLSTLTEKGLIYKNRHGKYSFAVPMLAGFIHRQDISIDY